MTQEIDPELSPGNTRRLADLLDRLKAQGTTQREVAARTKVSVQYLSDVKVGTRNFTELYARRLAEEFSVDYLWLLGRSDSMLPSRLSDSGERTDVIRLPVFSRPIEGEPTAHPDWDGTTIEIVGAAAARSRHATLPYILRIDCEDRRGRLDQNDLVLVSQAIGECNAIQVIKVDSKLILARAVSSSEWEALQRAKKTIKLAAPVGTVLGIIWGVVH